MKKIVSLLLSLAIIFALATHTFASSIGTILPPNEENRIIYKQDTREYALEPGIENVAAACYGLDESIIDISDSVTLQEYVIKNYTVSDSEHTTYKDWKMYDPDGLSELIPYCDSDNDILYFESNPNNLFITYYSNDGNRIVLNYINSKLASIASYNEKTDSLILYSYTEYSENKLYTDFCYGQSATMTEAYMEYIQILIDKNDLKTLQKLKDIFVIIDDDGSISVDFYAIPPAKSSWKSDFSSVTAMTNDLKIDFPYYSGILRNTTVKHSDYLNVNLSVKIRESRNAYIKSDLDNHFFNIQSVVSEISTYLGIICAGVIDILDVLNISIDVENKISEAVTLHKSASYNYAGTRISSVYDPVEYNDYIISYNNLKYGQFHGGYNSSGEWTWIDFLRPSSFTATYDQTAIAGINAYDDALYAYGGMHYFPLDTY